MFWLGALWQVLADVGPAGLVAGTAVAACALLAIVLAARTRPDPTPAPSRPATTARAMRNRIGVPRHRDPDAPGRSRPRAPTAATAAA